MKKIGTHNSCTGEKGYSWRKLFTLFSKCQSKTIKEQFNIGVRYFDIRIRITKRGVVAAHGLWESKKQVKEILKELNTLAINEKTYVSITYEGKAKYEDFKKYINSWKGAYRNLTFVYIAIKKPYWYIVDAIYLIHTEIHYKKLDFSSWHTLIPIPILWKKIYYNKTEFNNDVFKIVDFI